MMGQHAVAIVGEVEASPLLERATQATREDLLHLEAAVAARVLPSVLDLSAAGMPLRCGARTVVALPLDLRRFVRAMARHLCFN